MTSLKECRENAAECFGWAKRAKSVKEQEIFLQMASTWLMAATNLEARARRAAAPELLTASRRKDLSRATRR
jgi:hypothetical protein